MTLQDALTVYKTKTRLAKALGLTCARVSQWGDEIPELYACKLEVLNHGQLRAYKDSEKNMSLRDKLAAEQQERQDIEDAERKVQEAKLKKKAPRYTRSALSGVRQLNKPVIKKVVRHYEKSA